MTVFNHAPPLRLPFASLTAARSVICLLFFFKYIHLYFYFFPILFFFSLLELTSVYNLARAIDSYGWALSYFWCRPLLTTAFKSETGFLLQPTYTAELGR